MDPTEYYWFFLCAFCLVGLLPDRTVICDEQSVRGGGVTSNQSNVGSHHSGYEQQQHDRRTFNVKGIQAKYCTMNQLFCIPGNYSK